MNLPDVGTSIGKRLSAHGYGFQYAVIRRSEELSNARRSKWLLGATEFPVVTGGHTTHIDFVLQTLSEELYLVAECKKADPARGRWCFVRAPYTRRDPDRAEVVFDRFRCKPLNIVTDELATARAEGAVYHLGLELKTGQRGEGGGGKSVISHSIAQVFRGTSGLINYLFDLERREYERERSIKFVPVIFTTADLWVSEADLGAARLADGVFDSNTVEASKVDWLWLSHNRSPALRHDLEWKAADLDLSRALRREFTRSVAVVSPDGVDAFLGKDMESWLRYA